jgi:hypothetical protein
MLLTKAELKLAKLTSKESRYTLQAIAVEKDCTVVTNGHYLVTVGHANQEEFPESRFPETPGLVHGSPNGKPVLVHRDSAIAAEKALPNKPAIPVTGTAALAEDGKLWTNDLSSVQTFGTRVEGTFPNWQAVIPAEDKPQAVKFGVSAEYLRLLSDYFEKVQGKSSKQGKSSNHLVKVTVYSPEDSIKFETETADGQKVVAVLMPMRIK